MDSKRLAERSQGIGGADAAAALGLDPYRTPLELFLLKTGQLPENSTDNRFTRCGAALEDAIANMYAYEYGVTLRRKHVALVHPKHEIIRANVDRTIVGERAIVELKSCDAYAFRYSGEWGEEGSDEIPMRYLLQVQHYLIVTGYPVGYLGVLVGGNDLKRYVIHHDPELAERMIEGELDFWTSYVEKRTPPAMDFTHPSAFALMRRLFPGSDGRMIDLPPEANDWHQVIVDAREEEKAAKAVQEAAKARMLEAMAGASIGRLQCGGEYRYSKVVRKAYEVAETEYQTLRYGAKQTRSVITKEVA